LGNPLRFIVTPGQQHDISQGIEIISGIRAEALLADKGYDCDALRAFAKTQGITPHIPPRNNRLEKRIYDESLYKERHKIECLFGFLKHYRRLFARFEKLKKRFLSFLHFAAAIQWIK
jgi:transposase